MNSPDLVIEKLHALEKEFRAVNSKLAHSSADLMKQASDKLNEMVDYIRPDGKWIELTDKQQPPDKGFSKTMRVFYLTRKGFPSESKDVLSAYFCVIELPALPTDCE